MGLAPYFDKVVLAASHVLGGFDLGAFEETLESHVPFVVFNQEGLSLEGRVTLDLLVNLLARLYPRLGVQGYDDPSEREAERLRQYATTVNPDIELVPALTEATVGIVVGRPSVSLGVPTFYLGSDGWIATLSSSNAQTSGSSTNPFGAAASACFGAANVFRLVFREQLETGAPDESIRLSIYDFGQGAEATSPEFGDADLGEAFLVGVGAIGNATAWTFARSPGLAGSLHLIDPQQIDTGNVQRYILTGPNHVGKLKVDVATEALASASNLSVTPHALSWGDYLAEREDYQLDTVGVALDSAADRIAVQSSLPRWIVNAWTQKENLGVSRHWFLDDRACLACLYMPDRAYQSDSERIAAEIGLPEAELEVRAMLARRDPVNREMLDRIAAANGVDAAELFRFEGRDLYGFHSEAVCGGVVLRLGGGSTSQQSVEAPMAFQSALAGVLLAAEMTVHAVDPQADRPTRTEINLLRPLGERLSQNDKKADSSVCLCQDQDFVDGYHAKYEPVH